MSNAPQEAEMSADPRDGGLSVCRVRFQDGKERHIVARLEPINDGAAFEYHDPVTGEVVGCVGVNKVREFVTPLVDWAAERTAPAAPELGVVERLLADAEQRTGEAVENWYAFPQLWSSTALGFGGPGGQAITTAQTFIAITSGGRACIYFAGRFAYEADECAASRWASERRAPSLAARRGGHG